MISVVIPTMNQGEYLEQCLRSVVDQQYLPDELKGAKFYAPGTVGFEKQLQKRLDFFASRRSKGKK